jgi:hypothetical protein
VLTVIARRFCSISKSLPCILADAASAGPNQLLATV